MSKSLIPFLQNYFPSILVFLAVINGETVDQNVLFLREQFFEK